MKTFDVFVNRYNEFADKPYRGTIRTFYVADWTTAQLADVGLTDLRGKQPPVAQFDVGGPYEEDFQRELANRVCNYLNKLEAAKAAVKVDL